MAKAFPITATMARDLMDPSYRLKLELIDEIDKVVMESINKGVREAYVDIKYRQFLDFIRFCGYYTIITEDETKIKLRW